MSERKKENKDKPESVKPYLTLTEQTDVISFLDMCCCGPWKCDIPKPWRDFAYSIRPKLKESMSRYRAMCEIAEGRGQIHNGQLVLED